MAQPIITTERLVLRPSRDEDRPLFVSLNGDPEVMRFLLGRAVTPVETATEWDRRLGVQSDPARGLGYWTGFVDGTFVGWWSASSFATDATTAGLGYRLRATSWGAGLASEGARAMVAHAFGVPGVERVVASTMAVNTGSRRVLEKAGLLHVRTVVEEWDDPLPGAELGEVVYEVTRLEWSRDGR